MHVQITIPDQNGEPTPLAGVRFVVLPYDRDSVLQELERRAAEPRPDAERLDSLLAAFRQPFAAYLPLAAAESRIRESLDSVRAKLDSVPRGDPAYAALYARHTELDDSLRALAPSLDRARESLARARSEILPRADSLRRILTAWQNSAYRSYDSLTSAIVRQSRRDPVTDSTRANGWATVSVPGGDWWIYARAVHVLDPNSEWYWNLKITGDTVRLSPATGRTRPRL